MRKWVIMLIDDIVFHKKIILQYLTNKRKWLWQNWDLNKHSRMIILIHDDMYILGQFSENCRRWKWWDQWYKVFQLNRNYLETVLLKKSRKICFLKCAAMCSQAYINYGSQHPESTFILSSLEMNQMCNEKDWSRYVVKWLPAVYIYSLMGLVGLRYGLKVSATNLFVSCLSLHAIKGLTKWFLCFVQLQSWRQCLSVMVL